MSCRHCGAEYEKRPSEIAAGRGKFCSRRCAGLGRPLNGRPSAIADAAIAAFRESHPYVACTAELRIGRFAVDLALTDLRVAVELDGEYWHSLPDIQDKDRRKDRALAAEGWRVIRIPIVGASTPESLASAIAKALVSETIGAHR